MMQMWGQANTFAKFMLLILWLSSLIIILLLALTAKITRKSPRRRQANKSSCKTMLFIF